MTKFGAVLFALVLSGGLALGADYTPLSRESTQHVFRVASFATTGAVTIGEGMLADSTIVSADIKNGTIVSADIDTTGAFTFGSLTTTGAVSVATLTASGTAQVGAGLTIVSGAYTGLVNIVGTTLTLVVNGSVTNVIDADIGTP